MKWLLGCGTLFVLALILFVVPARLEGPVLVPISPGRGLSLVEVALVPSLAGTGLLAGGLWQRRQRLDAALTRRPWSARVGAFVAGLGLDLLVASVFAFFGGGRSAPRCLRRRCWLRPWWQLGVRVRRRDPDPATWRCQARTATAGGRP
jgi:hypothetical protein